MQHLPVKVFTYSGYKADEHPVRFIWLEKEFTVRGVLDRWYQTDRDPEVPAADYFRVKTQEQVFILRHELNTGRWYLVI